MNCQATPTGAKSSSLIYTFSKGDSQKPLKLKLNRRRLVTEGGEGVKWELGFAFFGGWEMRFCTLGLGFMKEKNNRKMGMGFQFEQHRLGL